jgi:uncharacterized membrane protein YjfL (UPF0719 family)
MDCKKLAILSGVATSIFSTQSSFIIASDNVFDIAFQPLQSLDISSFYNLYHYWVDFFIFVCLFVSIAKFTLGRRFQGREGNALSVVIGLALALALSLLEYKTGLSIKSFGSMAAGILLLVFGMVLFYLIKAVGAGNVGAGSFAFVITYFLLRATLPDWFKTLEQNYWFAWVDLGFLVAVVISIGKIIGSLWEGPVMKPLGQMTEQSRVPVTEKLLRNVGEEKQELSLVKQDLKRITKDGIKESGDIIARLREMIRIIEQYGSTDRARHLIAEKLKEIIPKENQILKRLVYLKDLSQKIEALDSGTFKEIRARWDKVPEKERDIIREGIKIEKNKIISEEKLQQLETRLTKYDNDFRYSLSSAVDCLKFNQPVQAREWLLKAIKYEEEAMIIFKEMNGLENLLLNLTKREFRDVKQEIRDEKV